MGKVKNSTLRKTNGRNVSGEDRQAQKDQRKVKLYTSTRKGK